MRLIKSQPVTWICLFLLMLLLSLWGSLNSPLAAAEQTPGIAFISVSDKGDRAKNGLFTIKPNGQGRTLLTYEEDISSPLVWSPNNRRLAFVGNDVPYIINADGSSLKQLLKESSCSKTPTYDIRWLSDSKQIAFKVSCNGSTADDSGVLAVYLSDTTKKQGTKLIQDLDTDKISSGLFLSPDGKRAAFVKNNDIYVMNTDGSKVANITNQPGEYSSGGSYLTWSPDGTRLAFYVGQYPKQQLYVINADGSNLTNLTNNPDNEIYNGNVAWAPDSSQIAFYGSEEVGDILGNKQNIYAIAVKGGKPTNLTKKPGEYDEINWSPDGKQIAFVLGEFSQQKIYAIKSNGQNRTNLTPNPLSFIVSLNWSPDSKRIAFAANESTRSVIYVINRDGSGLRKLTNNPNFSDYFPTWQRFSPR